MGDIVTKTKLENASVDCQTLEDCINGPADTKVLSRLGSYYWTLATIDSKVNSVVVQSNIAISQINSQKNNVDAQASSAIASINNSKNSAQGALTDAINDFNSQGNSALSELQSAINTIVIDDGVPALVVSTSNGTNQQQINDAVGAGWYAKFGGYALGDRVRLLTGEIVQSTVNANTNNPNINMTGWVKTSLITINYVSEFTKINPSLGLIVFLTKYDIAVTTGGGFFECKAGSAIVDGGHIFASRESGFYFERLANDVNLIDYGIKSTAFSSITTSTEDQAPKIKAAIARCLATGLPLVSPFDLITNNNIPSEKRKFVYIKSAINFTGVRVFHGDLSFAIHADSFTPHHDVGTNLDWAVVNLNCTFDGTGKKYYGTSGGTQTLGGVSVRNLTARDDSPVLSGILTINAHSNFQNTWAAYGFVGHGIWCCDTYDSNITDFKIEECGSPLHWALNTKAYPSVVDKIDECNALTVGNIMVHNCYDRAMYLRFGKSTICRIHQEKTFVTTTDYDPSIDDGAAKPSTGEFAYINTYIQLSDSTLLQYEEHDTASATNVGKVCTLHRPVDATYNTILSTAGYQSFAESYGANKSLSIGTITAGQVYIASNVIGGIDAIRTLTTNNCTGQLKCNGSISIGTGTIGGNYIGSSTVEVSGRFNVGGSLTAVGGSYNGSVVPAGTWSFNESRVNGRLSCNVGGLIAGQSQFKSLYYNGANPSTDEITITGNASISGGALPKVTCTANPFISETVINNLTISPTASTLQKGSLRDVIISAAVNFNENTNMKIDNSSLRGQTTILGNNSRAVFEDTEFQVVVFNPSATNSYFLTKGTQLRTGGSVTTWNEGNNKPPVGSISTRPDTGETKMYTSTGWKAITTAT